MSYHKITDHIYVGSIMGLRDKSLARAGVTHVLSVFGPDGYIDESSLVLLNEIPRENHKRVQVEDMESVNLMQYFTETNAFIDSAVKQNSAVLVHCIAGISRSVTCVCAFLMRQNKWTAEQAIAFVQSRRPIANPNSGFREQLECYYRCGYDVTPASKPYREFLLSQRAGSAGGPQSTVPIYTSIEMPVAAVVWRQVAPILLKRARLDPGPDGPAPDGPAAELKLVEVNGRPFSATEPVRASLESLGGPVTQLLLDGEAIGPEVLEAVLQEVVSQTFAYRCKKCSATLASSASLRPHRPGARARCQDYFFEPIEWMRPELERGELEGRLSCPKCAAKVGSYSWKGVPCTCALWVTPAFKLGQAKVDRMASVSRAAL